MDPQRTGISATEAALREQITALQKRLQTPTVSNQLTWHRRAPQPADELVLIRANVPPWMCLLVWDDGWYVPGPNGWPLECDDLSQDDLENLAEQFGFEMARV